MSSKLSILLLLCLSTFIFSCQPNLDSKVDVLYKEVMKIHDEVMPEMSTMHRLKKKLEAKLAEGNPNETDKETIETVIEGLDFVDESMMNWMAEFKMPKSATVPEQLDYLEKEKVKIEKVNVDTKAIIKAAQTMVGDQ